MALFIPGRTLAALALAALLMFNALATSAVSQALESNNGQLEQLGEASAALLLAFAESASPDDDSYFAVGDGVSTGFGIAVRTVCGHGAVAHRIRISDYPVLPQAPPCIT